MNLRLILGFSVALVSGFSMLSGCDYEIPHADTTSSTGAAGQSSSGQGGMGQGGMGQGGGGGAESSSSSGQGGSAGQPMGTCKDEMPTCPPYTGPMGTQGVGFCRGSTTVCQLDDKWSPCDQEILPTVETCATNGDVNCDGVPPCTGVARATYSISSSQSMQDDIIVALAIDDKKNFQDGALYAVGGRSGMIGSPSNALRVLAWRRTAGGQLQDWSDTFSFTQSNSTNLAVATGVVVLPKSGDVVITGYFYGGTLAISPNFQLNSGSQSSFIARFSPMGAVINVVFIVGGESEARGITADADDNIYVVGNYSGAPFIDSVPLLAASGTRNGFVVSLSSSNNYRWQQIFGGPARQSVDAIALIDNANLAIATTFVGGTAVNMLNQPPRTFDAMLQPDILVSRLQTKDGLALWNKQIEGHGTDAKLDVAGLAASLSTIAVGGRFTKNVTIGTGMYATTDADIPDSFLATLKVDDGNFITHQAASEVGTAQELRAVAFDAAGDIILTGGYGNTFSLTNTTGLTTSNGFDAFVIKVDSNLKTRWARKFGDDAFQSAYALAIGNATGRVFVGGGFNGQLSGVTPPAISNGGWDAFILELSN